VSLWPAHKIFDMNETMASVDLSLNARTIAVRAVFLASFLTLMQMGQAKASILQSDFPSSTEILSSISGGQETSSGASSTTRDLSHRTSKSILDQLLHPTSTTGTSSSTSSNSGGQVVAASCLLDVGPLFVSDPACTNLAIRQCVCVQTPPGAELLRPPCA